MRLVRRSNSDVDPFVRRQTFCSTRYRCNAHATHTKISSFRHCRRSKAFVKPRRPETEMSSAIASRRALGQLPTSAFRIGADIPYAGYSANAHRHSASKSSKKLSPSTARSDMQMGLFSYLCSAPKIGISTIMVVITGKASACLVMNGVAHTNFAASVTTV